MNKLAIFLIFLLFLPVSVQGQAVGIQVLPTDAATYPLVIDVRDFGAMGNGVTDDTAEIQAALSSAIDGDIVFFPGGVYIISSVFAAITENINISGTGATLDASARLTDNVFTFNSVTDCTVSGLTYAGEETLAAFSGAVEADVFGFIRLTSCTNVRVENIKVSKCGSGIMLNSCTDCIVDDVSFTGIFTTEKAGDNFASAVRIYSGTGNKVTNVYAVNSGSCVTGVQTINDTIISHCSGTGFRDNAIYISSGLNCQVIGCNFWGLDSECDSGVKARGSRHIVSNNYIVGSDNGITITGMGDTPDAYGANGHGTVCQGNVISACTRNGVRVYSVDGLFCRDVSIIGNTFNDMVNPGGYASVLAYVERGLIIHSNIINGNTSDYAIVAAGTGTDIAIAPDISIVNNILTACSGDGIRAVDITKSVISFNIFSAITSGHAIDIRNVTDSTFIGNSYPESNKAVIYDSATYANYRNVYTFNHGELEVAAARQITNRLYANYNTSATQMTLGATDATPSVEGGGVFITGAAGALDVTDFDDPVRGQVITILGADGGNTTVKHNVAKVNLVGAADWVSANGASLVLWYDGTDWCEISRSAPTMA